MEVTARVLHVTFELTEYEVADVHNDIEKLFRVSGITTPEDAQQLYPVLYDFYNLIRPSLPIRDPSVTSS